MKTIRICSTPVCNRECEMGSPYCSKCEERHAEARDEIADQRAARFEYSDFNGGGCDR